MTDCKLMDFMEETRSLDVYWVTICFACEVTCKTSAITHHGYTKL